MTTSRWPLALSLTDLALLSGSLAVADWAKRHVALGQEAPPGAHFVTAVHLVVLWAAWTFSARAIRLYSQQPGVAWAMELRRMTGALAFTGIILTAAVFLLKDQAFSRAVLLYFAVLGWTSLALSRLLLRWARGWLRSTGYGTRRALVVGTGDLGRRVASALEAAPWPQTRVAGFIADGPARDLPVLGVLRDVERVVLEQRVDDVVIALGSAAREEVAALVRQLQWTPVRIKVAPDYLDLATVRAEMYQAGDVPLLELRPPVIEGFDALLKRGMDVVGAALGLALGWPLMALCALLVKLDSPGPVLFRQVRTGENGRPFTLLKFRTMFVGARPIPPVRVGEDGLGKATLKIAFDDPSVTRWGRWMRRYSLDELPQLWNVLKGEMSLVGPRPEVPAVVRLYSPMHLKRLAVKPGLTGPMQVNGRSQLCLDDRVRLELAYMRSYSLWQDLRLIARTVTTLLSARGAR